MKPTPAKTLFGSLWPAAPANLIITGVVTDSRAVQPGCAFVAIRGERVDGHDYAAGAIQAGAALVVAQHPVPGIPHERTVLVADPLDAMIALGGRYRDSFNPLVVGVTGSVGKTTTKEYCAAVFSSFGPTVKTEGNQNNEIGMPNTLFRIDDDTRYAVIEMGMQGLGEIHKLTMAARPDAAIITRIGTAHIELLGSVENIRKAKLEICDSLPAGAPLIVSADDPLLWQASLPAGVCPVYIGIHNPEAEVRAHSIETQADGQHFVLEDRRFGRHNVWIPALGEHNVADALEAYAAATRMGLDAAAAAAALAGFKTAGMRQNIQTIADITFINDFYNANPDSMRAALTTLVALPVQGRRIAVLGDMFELGDIAETAHRELGALCAQLGVDRLLAVGQLAQFAAREAQSQGVETAWFADTAAAANALQQLMCPGDAVLLKASRGMHFENLLDACLNGLSSLNPA